MERNEKFRQAYEDGTLELKSKWPFRILAWPGDPENPLNRIYGVYQEPNGNWIPVWWYLCGKTPSRKGPNLDLVVKPRDLFGLMYDLQRFTYKAAQGSCSPRTAEELNADIKLWLRRHDV